MASWHVQLALIAICSLAYAIPAADSKRVPAWKGSLAVSDSAHDGAILSALNLAYRMEYRAADSLLSASLPAGDYALAYFRALILFNAFNDLGDTTALRRAESLLEETLRLPASGTFATPAPQAALYRGLSTLQLSYIASVHRQGIRAARLGRKSASELGNLAGFAEADAALALYEYYKGRLFKGISFLPFMASDAAGPIARLETSSTRSRYLTAVFRTSLIWIYYDNGLYDQGLRLIDDFLSRYPRSRVYRQMRADFLYREGDAAAAAAIHENLKSEYAKLPMGLPLGYLSSVGNLAKAYARLGRRDSLENNLRLWSSSQFEAHKVWLPKSLVQEVDEVFRSRGRP